MTDILPFLCPMYLMPFCYTFYTPSFLGWLDGRFFCLPGYPCLLPLPPSMAFPMGHLPLPSSVYYMCLPIVPSYPLGGFLPSQLTMCIPFPICVPMLVETLLPGRWEDFWQLPPPTCPWCLLLCGPFLFFSPCSQFLCLWVLLQRFILLGC